MFNKLKKVFESKNKGNAILSPLEGDLCPICEVKDPTFGEEILGKGVAIKPSKGRVVAPVNGTVAVMFETKHALSIVSEQGTEILIHIGLDTVRLKGEHFTSHVKTGDKVNVGDLLVEFDLDKIQAAGYDVITPIVICNTADYSNIQTITGKRVKELDVIINIKS